MTEEAGGARAPTWTGSPAGPSRPDSTNLADILERVLDKGIVIAGDIKVNLLDIELLTIKLRLVVASVERAREMGIDWWESDPTLSSGQRNLAEENQRLREQVRELEDAGGTPHSGFDAQSSAAGAAHQEHRDSPEGGLG